MRKTYNAVAADTKDIENRINELEEEKNQLLTNKNKASC
jgi:hypothetical protein